MAQLYSCPTNSVSCLVLFSRSTTYCYASSSFHCCSQSQASLWSYQVCYLQVYHSWCVGYTTIRKPRRKWQLFINHYTGSNSPNIHRSCRSNVKARSKPIWFVSPASCCQPDMNGQYLHSIWLLLSIPQLSDRCHWPPCQYLPFLHPSAHVVRATMLMTAVQLLKILCDYDQLRRMWHNQ
jgi:hypothetical protein